MNANFTHKKILIAPLDWGLGHATRCIVLIHELRQLNFDITVACSGKIKELLQTEFPNLEFLHLKGYEITYTKSKRFLPFKILIQIPKILKNIRYEHKWLKVICKEHFFDAVISDNRYGFHAGNTVSVFITHQLLIKTNFTWLDKKLQRINYKYINLFSECWVPDFKEKLNLAGKMSHPEFLPKIPIKYLGPLSRFKKTVNNNLQFKWMVILSGPEPQRTLFEKKVLEFAAKSNDTFFIVRGLPGTKENNIKIPNCKIFNHLNTTEMQQAIEQSEYIISRCGYTTVMEVLSLQKKAIFIPTPGQTEQEYLAKHLVKQNWCYTFNQTEGFSTHLEIAQQYQFKLPSIDSGLYKIVLKEFAGMLHKSK